MSGDLDGRVAVVTGAGRGLGRAEALELAANGARVIVNDFGVALDGGAERENPAEEVAAEIRAAGGEAIAHEGDVAEAGDDLVRAAIERFGALDVLVNNAGILRDAMVFSMSREDFEAVIRVHLTGHFTTLRAATAYWRARAKEDDEPVYARVVNTASEAFLLGSPGQPNYAAAKGGIIGLTLSTAFSCGKYGVRANAICPRARTRMTAGVFGGGDEGDDPLDPAHVARFVAFLASPASERISGQVFVVHGGVVGLLGAPRVEARFAAERGSWTPAELRGTIGGYFADRDPRETFAALEVLDLAEAGEEHVAVTTK